MRNIIEANKLRGRRSHECRKPGIERRRNETAILRKDSQGVVRLAPQTDQVQCTGEVAKLDAKRFAYVRLPPVKLLGVIFAGDVDRRRLLDLQPQGFDTCGNGGGELLAQERFAHRPCPGEKGYFTLRSDARENKRFRLGLKLGQGGEIKGGERTAPRCRRGRNRRFAKRCAQIQTCRALDLNPFKSAPAFCKFGDLICDALKAKKALTAATEPSEICDPAKAVLAHRHPRRAAAR